MRWNGEYLGNQLAVDTETKLIESQVKVPQLVLVTVSNGKGEYWLPPARVNDFLTVHKASRFYFYNAPFDFWVLVSQCESRILWDAANSNRLCCLQLLWRLVKLATMGEPKRQGTLQDACEEFATGVSVNKTDPYRLRYHELLTHDNYEDHPEWEGFCAYALADAKATYSLIVPLESRAACIQAANREGLHPNAIEKWGLLSVYLQTRGALALSFLSRQPLRVDKAKAQTMADVLRQQMAQQEDLLEEMLPGLFDRYKKKNNGARKLSDNGIPKKKEKPLQDYLAKAAKEKSLPVLKTDSGSETSLSHKLWIRHLPSDPIVKEWSLYEERKKTLSSFLCPILESSGFLYVKYEPLLKTGRTSASRYKDVPSINVQQIPRDTKKASIRDLFLADEGMQRITSDYDFLELRTLAACCLARFGHSELAVTVRQHEEATRRGEKALDPHEWMAALSLGIPPAEWHTLDAAKRKEARQRAKVANFGFPGGLGILKTIEYAKGYGVTLTRDAARQLKKEWLKAFPEMARWLEDKTEANLCHNLGCRPADLRRCGDLRILRSQLEGSNGEEATLQALSKLRSINRNRSLDKLLASETLSPLLYDELEDSLLLGMASTPTGLIRAKTGYCDGCNLGFQGLAAAGAKEALWRLLYAGYNLKAFIHDEILVDHREPEKLVKHKQRHMNEAMESVMLGNVPCRASSNIAPTWKKG